MKLTVVGCSGSFPGPESPASSYLVEADDFRLVVDLGNGALGHLQRYTDIYAVDAVIVSHLHADHFLDLCSYYVARRFHPEGRLSRVPVYGPRGTARRLARAYDLPEVPGMSEEFDIRTYAAGTFGIGPFRVTAARMAHPVETYGLRLEHAGHTIVYSGDTGPTDTLVDLARGADLLVAEASFIDGEDNPPDLHMTGREAGEHATRAGVGRLLVTHVPPWYDFDEAVDAARRSFAGRVDGARPGLVCEPGLDR